MDSKISLHKLSNEWHAGEFFKKAITTKSQFWDMAVYVFSSVWGLIEAKQSKIGDCYVNINWRRYQA